MLAFSEPNDLVPCFPEPNMAVLMAGVGCGSKGKTGRINAFRCASGILIIQIISEIYL